MLDQCFILTESSFGAGENKRFSFIKNQIEKLSANDDCNPFKKLLSNESRPFFEGPLVNMPEKNYGTRSSFVIKLTPDRILRILLL